LCLEKSNLLLIGLIQKTCEKKECLKECITFLADCRVEVSKTTTASIVRRWKEYKNRELAYSLSSIGLRKDHIARSGGHRAWVAFWEKVGKENHGQGTGAGGGKYSFGNLGHERKPCVRRGAAFSEDHE